MRGTGSGCAVTRKRLLGPLGARLALAFVAVAFAAVGVLAALAAGAARSQVADLVDRQHQDRATAVAAAAGQAYDAAGGWDGADMSSAAALAAAADAQLEIRDRDGGDVVTTAQHEMMGDLIDRMHGEMGSMMMNVAPAALGAPVTATVASHGQVVGTVALRFAADGLPAPERQVRDALLRNLAVGAGLAALVALVVGVLVSRRLTRPLGRLAAGARAIESGDLTARVDLAGEPGELGEVGAAFDRMATALAREDALRRALVADVAHELRTPVAILQASCEAMLDGVEPTTPERLSSLHDETLRLGNLVADLETLSAAEAAGLRLDRRPVDLAAVAGDAVTSLEGRAGDAGVGVDADLTSAVVEGDPRRLHQVAVNLLANAVKFTPAGGTITVSTRSDGALSILEVTDTGPGIPPEELPHIFDRFWRGRDAHTTSGSGIGLAVVAELVRAHNGRVEVTSQPGRGARFQVFLPQP